MYDIYSTLTYTHTHTHTHTQTHTHTHAHTHAHTCLCIVVFGNIMAFLMQYAYLDNTNQESSLCCILPRRQTQNESKKNCRKVWTTFFFINNNLFKNFCNDYIYHIFIGLICNLLSNFYETISDVKCIDNKWN